MSYSDEYDARRAARRDFDRGRCDREIYDRYSDDDRKKAYTKEWDNADLEERRRIERLEEVREQQRRNEVARERRRHEVEMERQQEEAEYMRQQEEYWRRQEQSESPSEREEP